MKIFSSLFHSRDKPKNSTAGSSFRFFTGGSTAGKNVTERSAMQMTAVYSCVRVLSEAVAGLPLHLYKYTKNGGKEKSIDHPLYFLLHDEPNPEMTSFVFRETLMTHFSEPRTDDSSNAKIANILEYGTSSQPAKPFLKPAKSAVKKQCVDAMKSAFEKEVEGL
ncbi:MAG: phage portal protein [Oscillospiraceae bacterium]